MHRTKGKEVRATTRYKLQFIHFLTDVQACLSDVADVERNDLCIEMQLGITPRQILPVRDNATL